MQPVSSNNSDQQIVIRVRPAKAAFDWFKQGFNIFNQHKLAWVGVTLAVYLMLLVLSVIPVVGPIVGNILLAGLFPLAHAAFHTKQFEHKKVFEGFKQSLMPLLQVTLVNLLAVIACYAIAAQITGFKQLATPSINDVYQTIIVFLILYAPVILAMLFAPALIILHKISVWQAIKMSFVGGFKNSISMTVFGVIMIFAMMLALMPAGLGLVFLLPIMHCTLYVIFQDIFHSRTPFSVDSQPEDEDSMYV